MQAPSYCNCSWGPGLMLSPFPLPFGERSRRRTSLNPGLAGASSGVENGNSLRGLRVPSMYPSGRFLELLSVLRYRVFSNLHNRQG